MPRTFLPLPDTGNTYNDRYLFFFCYIIKHVQEFIIIYFTPAASCTIIIHVGIKYQVSVSEYHPFIALAWLIVLFCEMFARMPFIP